MPSSQSIAAKLLDIQKNLKVGKGKWNDYSGFNYRTKEDILDAAKPICHSNNLILVCEDEVVLIDNGWVYIKSTASITDTETGESFSVCGLAREPESKKGMDASQITGTASSYAGKRALGNLFAIDNTMDADSLEPEEATEEVKEPPAKKQSEAAEKLNAACADYANATGLDLQEIKRSVAHREGFEATDACYLRIAGELRDEIA